MLTRNAVIGVFALAIIAALAVVFVHELSPVGASAGASMSTDTDASSSPVIFQIKQGDGFRGTVQNLYAANLIRSPLATEAYLLLTGRALTLKPGLYRLSPTESSFTIASIISGQSSNEVTVTIPEGSNIYQIDSILTNALVIRAGDLINLNKSTSTGLEGKLFPDTYNFFTNANINDVVQEFLANFTVKAAPLLASGTRNEEQDLILASILEKEVSSSTDQKIVAGILLKRLAAGMPLDVDASVCYAKLIADPSANCSSLTAIDFKINSPYNTYTHIGLPPTPIGNPGVAAITAALHPQASPYWYYLSDPKTGETIYAATLAEQEANQRKYLNQ